MPVVQPLGGGVIIRWDGGKRSREVTRACERATLAIAEHAASEAKIRVHRITGTLSRSIHTFDEEYRGQGDEAVAKDGEVQGLRAANVKGGVVTVLVGSLISYAKYEERLHPFMKPAFDVAIEGAGARFRMALAQEGIT